MTNTMIGLIVALIVVLVGGVGDRLYMQSKLNKARSETTQVKLDWETERGTTQAHIIALEGLARDAETAAAKSIQESRHESNKKVQAAVAQSHAFADKLRRAYAASSAGCDKPASADATPERGDDGAPRRDGLPGGFPEAVGALLLHATIQTAHLVECQGYARTCQQTCGAPP